MAGNKESIVAEIAKERILILYTLANEEYRNDPDLSARYLGLIKQISRHYKIKLDKNIKRHICSKCGALLVPGKSLSIKLASSKRSIIYKCLDCGTERGIPY